MKNEKTSPRVASIAARVLDHTALVEANWSVLAVSPDVAVGLMEFCACVGLGDRTVFGICNVKELSSVAASALTQTPDRPKKRKVKRVR